MNRWFMLGGVSVVAGLLLLVLKGLASLMPGDPDRFDFSLKTWVDPAHLAWIDSLAGSGLKAIAFWVEGAPLYIHCFGVGALLIVFSGLKKE